MVSFRVRLVVVSVLAFVPGACSPERPPSSNGVAARVASETPAGPPNIVLALLDDLGKEWVSCYGGDGARTPRIDALADEGARFERFYATPQCTPTRVTLLTGQYPFRHGWVNFWDVPSWGHGAHFDPERNPSLARTLRGAGYRTFIAGKWQLNDFRVQPDVLADHGFDDWCVWTGQEGGNAASASRYFEPYVHTREGSRTLPGEFGPDVFVDAAIEFLKAHPDDPTLVYYSMVLPHKPWGPTPAEPGVTGDAEQHAAMVRYADRCIGRLVDAVDAMETAADTVVIVTSDNGTARRQKARLDGRLVEGGKSLFSEPGVCVPLVIRWPARLAPSSVVEDLVDMTDLLPTLAELAGATPPGAGEADGLSFAPLLRGEPRAREREWILAMGAGAAAVDATGRVVPVRAFAQRAIRDRRWKLIVDVERRPAALFDLEADPFETTDLLRADDEAAREGRERLMEIVRSLPARDAAPRYERLPPRAWDLENPRRPL